ncbi:MAG: V-type ATP synthase subunit F [Eubacteriaceae bacterium]|jgi:V/A-type H+-transporting ATPase subunit F|nr:V-type ATP synthase subunit F [Eubacteriaceae bacterium]
MYKIAVIGDRESVLSFKALGIETVPVNDAAEAKEQLHRMAEEGYAVIYLTEQLATDLKHELAVYAERVTPAIILMPGQGESLGIGLKAVKEAVERAVGADILGE